jgi:hypothetical protein
MTSSTWSSYNFEEAYDLYIEAKKLRDERERFAARAERLSFEDFFVAAMRRLPDVELGYESFMPLQFPPADFDDIELSHLRQLPRKSAGNCEAGSVHGSPVTGQGQRMARDPS